MNFDSAYVDHIKDMVDGPRKSKASGPGLPEHTDEFKGLLEDHWDVPCFHPTKTAQLEGNYSNVHSQIDECAKDPSFSHLGPKEYPNRQSFSKLKRGYNQPQTLKILTRQQFTLKKLASSGGDLDRFPELKRMLMGSGSTLFVHEDNSVKASLFRIKRTEITKVRQALGASPKALGMQLFGTANGHNTLEKIASADQSNLYSVTIAKRDSLLRDVDELLQGSGIDPDNFNASIFVTTAQGKIDPILRDHGNDLS